MGRVELSTRILRSSHPIGLGNLLDPRVRVGRVNPIGLKPDPTITLQIMRNILLKTNILNLLNCRNITKSSSNKLIFRSNYNKINIDKEKSQKEKSTKRKSIRNTNIVKIIQIDNIFSTNIQIFCDSKNKSKSSILLLFVKLENIKS